MGKITLVIDDEAEELIRQKNRRKGDLGRLVSKAIMAYLSPKKGDYKSQ